MRKILIILFILLIPLISSAADSHEITMIWEANKEADLAGYKVYSKKGSDPNIFYTLLKDVGNVNRYTLLVDPNIATAYILTAYDTTFLESQPTEPLFYDRPDSPKGYELRGASNYQKNITIININN